MNVLIADDDQTIRLLLQRRLEKWGYDVTVVEDGAAALAVLLGADAPPLALLDWMMPELSGPEVCTQVRAQGEHGIHYLVLVTAKAERQDIAAGLDAGADDFLSKPIDFVELKSRLNVGCRIINNEMRLQEFATEMESLAADRARQLVHADRLATLGTMAAGIAHEINNPLSYLSGNAQNLERAWSTIDAALQGMIEAGHADTNKATFLRDEAPAMLGSMRKGVDRISTIVRGLKGFSRREVDEQLVACNVNTIIESALEICQPQLKHTVVLDVHLAEKLPPVMVIAQQLEQVFINLFVNAAQAMDAMKNGILTIITEPQEDGVRITVKDSGTGIPADKLDSIWEAFFTTKAEGRGTGLGLSISKGIIETFAGAITVTNHPEGGAVFVITLPPADGSQ